MAALLALLIGLTYILEGFRTRVLYSHLKHPLHRLTEIAPGLLSIVPRVADVIIGLLLLMLSHGLRRRKRRAWPASGHVRRRRGAAGHPVAVPQGVLRGR
jgi:lysylphosphatidylglycerol synthetase-like protein (DUF2156 family)